MRLIKMSDDKVIKKSFTGTAQRLDLFLSLSVANLSRSRAQKLIEQNCVNVNCKICADKSFLLQDGDIVALTIPRAEKIAVKPEKISLDIVYEDKSLLVINKPRGMVVHPAPGHSGGTLVNALLSWCKDLSGIGGVIRPGIVHRLDKNTSGLLLVAKNDFTHQHLSLQLKSKLIDREYLALVKGNPPSNSGKIEVPIGRHPTNRKKMAVVARGRNAITRFYLLKKYKNYSLLKIMLETGRTHQIRVHLAYIGIPVVGDSTYGRSEYRGLPAKLSEPQALHARRLSFVHPVTGKKICFSVPVPPEYRELLHHLYRVNP